MSTEAAGRAEELNRLLDLQPHPEAGFYREVHRSEVPVEAGAPPAKRSAITSIYFLLAGADV